MLTQPQAQPSSSSSSDLGSLTSGSVQRVLIKTKLPVVRAGAAKGLLAKQDVAFCTLRYKDTKGGGGDVAGILREQTLQVVALRSRRRTANPGASAVSVEPTSPTDDTAKDEDPMVWYERARLNAVRLLDRLKAWAEGAASSDLVDPQAFFKTKLKRMKQRHLKQEREQRDRWAVNDGGQEQEQDTLGRMITWRVALDTHALLLDDLQACLAALGPDRASTTGKALVTAAWYTHARRKGGVVRAKRGSVYGCGSTGAAAIREEALGFFEGLVGAEAVDKSTMGAAAVQEEAGAGAVDVLDDSRATAASSAVGAEEGQQEAASPQRHRRRRPRGKRGGAGKKHASVGSMDI